MNVCEKPQASNNSVINFYELGKLVPLVGLSFPCLRKVSYWHMKSLANLKDPEILNILDITDGPIRDPL